MIRWFEALPASIDSWLFGGTWAVAWIIWAGLALGGFFLLEFTAIGEHHMERTLSENIRRWLGIYPVRRWRRLGGLLFAGILGTLVTVFIWHILTP